MLPLSIPNFEGNEEKYVLDAVSQGWVSTGGKYVEQFEEKIAQYAGVKGAVACQSGTAGLHLSLLECNVTDRDMVIVPTLTFIAAVNPVKYIGASPIFMDCDDSLCLDPVKLNTFCETECRLENDDLIYKKNGLVIKALIVVHIFGNLADMEAIMKVAKRFHLSVIEDATEALGSYYVEGAYKDRMAGSIGDFGVFSFNGNKIITTGGGGMIIGRDEKSLNHIKYLSTQAKDDELFYIHEEIGYNYRMTNLQAALGVAQLEELEEFIHRKNKNFEYYKSKLSMNGKCRLLDFRNDIRSNKWFYSLEIPGCSSTEDIRNYVMRFQEKGIQTRPIWGLIHLQTPYKEDEVYDVEKSVYYSNRILNIPCSTNLTFSEIDTVCEVAFELFE